VTATSWSNSASISDYIAKDLGLSATAVQEHTYDSEGTLLGGISVEDGVPDAGEPTGGYLWKNFAEHGISYRHYGEYIVSRWCNAQEAERTCRPRGLPKAEGARFARERSSTRASHWEKNVGDPRGGPSPYPLGHSGSREKTLQRKSNCEDTSTRSFPDFEVAYPDQLRADECFE